jgi:NAD(P)H-dependent FMN reductase
MPLKFTIISGTNRPGNKTQRVAKFLNDVGSDFDEIETRIIKPADFDLSVDGNDAENKSAEYTEIVNETDAFIIISPEYNHSFPGSLKSLLDKELRAYNRRAVGLVGVSSGSFGGARAVEALISVVRELGLILSSRSMHIMKVGENFTKDGKTEVEYTLESAKKFYEDLIWLAKTLKAGRESRQ